MRYVLAIATLVLSGVLLLLGIGQRTFLAGPAEITYPVDTSSETGYAVVPGAELAKVAGQANIVVRGDQAFVATGMRRDVDGWVAPFPHAELSVDRQSQRVLSALIPAAEQEPSGGSGADEQQEEDAVRTDPRGSDLWLEERAIDEAGSGVETETLRVPVALAADQAVLIASDGEDPVPADVSLVWVQDRQTPWAGPLLVGGGALAVVGGILYLLAVDHDRRGLGPRRGRKGPLLGIRNLFGRRGRRDAAGGPDGRSGRAERRSMARRRAALVPAAGLAVALGLSGCSASYWPDFGPERTTPAPEVQPSSVAPVPVTDAQLDRIVQRVSEVAGEGDDTLDAAELEPRFTGDALAQRTANYTIRKAVPDYGVVPPRITDQELDYELVQSTESWPRTLFVTVASTAGAIEAPAGEPAPSGGEVETETETETPAEEQPEEQENASPSLALVLTQQSPHENYLVSRVIALRGGISMPQAAPAEDGTALLANDIGTLVLPPGEVGEAFASVLQNGADAEEAELFDLSTDTLLESYGRARAEQAQRESDEKDQTMRFSVVARQGDQRPVALSTGVGGALVATTVVEEQVVDAAGGRYKPQAAGSVTALSGLEGEQERLVQEVAHQMLFFVPSKSDGAKIELLGVTSELVGVRN